MAVPEIVDLEIHHEEFGDMFVMDTEDVLILMGTRLPIEVYLVNYKRQGATIEKIKEDIEEDYEQLIKRMNKYKVDFVPLNDNPMLFNFLI